MSTVIVIFRELWKTYTSLIGTDVTARRRKLLMVSNCVTVFNGNYFSYNSPQFLCPVAIFIYIDLSINKLPR